MIRCTVIYMKKIQITLNDEIHRKLKHQAVDSGLSMSAIAAYAINYFLHQVQIKPAPPPFLEENTDTHLKPIPPNYAPTVTMPSVTYPELR